jgi:hypothetical protein
MTLDVMAYLPTVEDEGGVVMEIVTDTGAGVGGGRWG